MDSGRGGNGVAWVVRVRGRTGTIATRARTIDGAAAGNNRVRYFVLVVGARDGAT